MVTVEARTSGLIRDDFVADDSSLVCVNVVLPGSLNVQPPARETVRCFCHEDLGHLSRSCSPGRFRSTRRQPPHPVRRRTCRRCHVEHRPTLSPSGCQTHASHRSILQGIGWSPALQIWCPQTERCHVSAMVVLWCSWRSRSGHGRSAGTIVAATGDDYSRRLARRIRSRLR